MTWALIGSKIVNFLKEVPIWVWILIVFAVTLKWTQMSSYKKGGDDKAGEIKERQAEVKAAVVERVSEIATEERENADHALEARDAGEHFPTADVVPIELQTIAFRNPRGS